jgi:hypothetical protein
VVYKTLLNANGSRRYDEIASQLTLLLDLKNGDYNLTTSNNGVLDMCPVYTFDTSESNASCQRMRYTTSALYHACVRTNSTTLDAPLISLVFDLTRKMVAISSNIQPVGLLQRRGRPMKRESVEVLD